jgi:hypothetical protein
MTALTYLLSRLFHAMTEARRRRAEAEVRKHLALVPKSTLARAGLKADYAHDKTLPFVR